MSDWLHRRLVDVLPPDVRQSAETVLAHCMLHTLANNGSSSAPSLDTSNTNRRTAAQWLLHIVIITVTKQILEICVEKQKHPVITYSDNSDDRQLRHSSRRDCFRGVFIWNVNDEIPTRAFFTDRCTTNHAVVTTLKQSKLKLASIAPFCHFAILCQNSNKSLH